MECVLTQMLYEQVLGCEAWNLIVRGDHFGYASQGSGGNEASPQFLAGHVKDWKVAIFPSNLELEGSSFSLPGMLL